MPPNLAGRLRKKVNAGGYDFSRVDAISTRVLADVARQQNQPPQPPPAIKTAPVQGDGEAGSAERPAGNASTAGAGVDAAAAAFAERSDLSHSTPSHPTLPHLAQPRPSHLTTLQRMSPFPTVSQPTSPHPPYPTALHPTPPHFTEPYCIPPHPAPPRTVQFDPTTSQVG